MSKLNYLNFVFIVILLCNQISFAQTIKDDTKEKEIGANIKIGAKIGYSLAKLTDSNDNIYAEDYESVSGVDWGFTAEFIQTELISIQTEINFTQRDGKRTGMQPLGENELGDQLNQFLPFLDLPIITAENPLYANFEAEQKLRYLEVPVLVKFGWGDDFRFYGEIGPYVGILLSAKQVTSGTSQFYFDDHGENPVFVPNPQGNPPFVELPAQSLDADTNIKDDLNTVNFGGIAGVGIIKKLGEKSEIFLDARGSYSFNPVQINEVFGKSHIGGVIFSLGYVFTL